MLDGLEDDDGTGISTAGIRLWLLLPGPATFEEDDDGLAVFDDDTGGGESGSLSGNGVGIGPASG